MSKIYFNKGDVAKLKLGGSPEMLVLNVDKVRREGDMSSMVNGIECMWFDGMQHIVKDVFDFKDLILVKKANEF